MGPGASRQQKRDTRTAALEGCPPAPRTCRMCTGRGRVPGPALPAPSPAGRAWGTEGVGEHTFLLKAAALGTIQAFT